MPCPFTFTQEELSKHAVESEGYDENAEFWSSISQLVTRSGFVLEEDYTEALELFASLREKGLQIARQRLETSNLVGGPQLRLFLL